MTSPTKITADEIAQVLSAGERDRTEVAQFSDTHPDIDPATAYAAQRAFV
jgi:2-keto-4-pentenoate hydratase